MSIATSGQDPRLEFGIADRLDKALKVGGVTSGQMAKHLEVSRTTISAYINGRSKPSKSQRRDWALLTGVPLEWIETGNITDNGNHDPDGGSQGTPGKITNR